MVYFCTLCSDCSEAVAEDGRGDTWYRGLELRKHRTEQYETLFAGKQSRLGFGWLGCSWWVCTILCNVAAPPPQPSRQVRNVLGANGQGLRSGFDVYASTKLYVLAGYSVRAFPSLSCQLSISLFFFPITIHSPFCTLFLILSGFVSFFSLAHHRSVFTIIFKNNSALYNSGCAMPFLL